MPTVRVYRTDCNRYVEFNNAADVPESVMDYAESKLSHSDGRFTLGFNVFALSILKPNPFTLAILTATKDLPYSTDAEIHSSHINLE